MVAVGVVAVGVVTVGVVAVGVVAVGVVAVGVVAVGVVPPQAANTGRIITTAIATSHSFFITSYLLIIFQVRDFSKMRRLKTLHHPLHFESLYILTEKQSF